MKCSVCGAVHWAGGWGGLVWRGWEEPQHDPGPLSGSPHSGVGHRGISIPAE